MKDVPIFCEPKMPKIPLIGFLENHMWGLSKQLFNGKKFHIQFIILKLKLLFLNLEYFFLIIRHLKSFQYKVFFKYISCSLFLKGEIENNFYNLKK